MISKSVSPNMAITVVVTANTVTSAATATRSKLLNPPQTLLLPPPNPPPLLVNLKMSSRFGSSTKNSRFGSPNMDDTGVVTVNMVADAATATKLLLPPLMLLHLLRLPLLLVS